VVIDSAILSIANASVGKVIVFLRSKKKYSFQCMFFVSIKLKLDLG
jgi:hypothetical protein